METMLESIARVASPPPMLVVNGGGMDHATALDQALADSAAAAAATSSLRHARSFDDCEQVLRRATLGNPKPTASPAPRPACGLLGGGELTAVQEDEDETAEVGGSGGGGC
jgi:hypothetical protein